MQLSGVLKESGHVSDVFINNAASNQTLSEILAFKPDIVAFSTTTPAQKADLELAEKIKEADNSIFVCVGGPHPTFYPQILEQNQYLDAICIGEGDIAILELADNINDKERIKSIKNFWVRDKRHIYENELRPFQDLDELPLPDFDLYFKKFENLALAETKVFMAGRGCPYPCSYCFNKKVMEIYKGKGSYVRYKRPRKIINEILEVKSKYPMKWVHFNDDSFALNKIWLEEFSTMYKESIGLPFLCNLRPNIVDEDLITILKDAGVDRVDFGVECGNEEFRKTILNRHVSNAQILRTGYLLNKYKIRFHTANMVGCPGETMNLAFETVRINQKMKPELASCSVLQPFPGTQIYDYAMENNLLKANITIDDFGAQKTWTSGDKRVHSLIVQENINKLVNLNCFFDLLVQHPKLEPIVKVLIKLPPNRFYQLLSQWGFFKVYFKYARNLKERIQLIRRLFKPLL